MNGTIAQGYKAELLIRLTSTTIPFRFAVNGGCNLGSKCSGARDYIAEEIQMPLMNSAQVTAGWRPGKRDDGSTFTATSAQYRGPGNDFFRFDNAHDRDVLHVDAHYKGQSRKHDERMGLGQFQMINRRRIALIRLMQTLEQNVDWRIPVWFYMPWCMWWPQYADFPETLRKRKPASVLVSNMCEAVLAHLCFSPDVTREFLASTGITRVTLESIDEAMDRVGFEFAKTGGFKVRQVILGHLTIVPFPMYAPPGSRLEGSSQLIEPFSANGN